MKNKYSFIFIFLTIIQCYILTGQGISSNFYGGCGSDNLVDMIMRPPYLYLLGNSYSFDWGRNIYICKIDTAGVGKWAKAYKTEGGSDIVSNLSSDRKGNLIFSGINSNGYSFISMIDTSGNVLFSKVLSNNNIINDILVTTDNKIIIVGCQLDSIEWFPQITRLDSIGNFIDSKLFRGGHGIVFSAYDGYGEAYSVAETKDRGIIITGETAIDLFNYPFIIKMDKAGNTQWTRTYNKLLPYKFKNLIFENSNNGYSLYGGNYRINITDPEKYEWGIDPFILRIDSIGKIVSSKTYKNINIYETISGKINAVISSNKNTFLSGTTGNWFYDSYEDTTQFYAICLDSLDNITWSYLYGGIHINRCNSSVESGNSIILGGYSSENLHGNIVSPLEYQTDLCLLKTGQSGFSNAAMNPFNLKTYNFINDTLKNTFSEWNYFFIPKDISLSMMPVFMSYDSSNCIGVGIEEIRNTIDDFKVFPNPAIDKVTIMFDDYINTDITFYVYNSNGILIRIIPKITSGSLILERNNLNSGLYYFRALNANGQIGKGKILFY